MPDENLEARLRALTPARPALDREAILFQLGRASAPPLWPWQLGSLAAVVLAVVWWQTPVTVIEVPRIVIVEVPVRTSPGEPTPAMEESPEWRDRPRHQRLQDHLLRHGLEGLQVPPPGTRTPTRSELLLELGISEGGL